MVGAPTTFGAVAVTFRVSDLFGLRCFSLDFSFLEKRRMNLEIVAGATIWVPPFKVADLPLPSLTLPATVTDACELDVMRTFTSPFWAIAVGLRAMTGHAVCTAALCGHLSWVSSPKPSLSASGSITAATGN